MKKEIVFLLTLILMSSDIINSQDFDRSTFGNAPFPFWFNLTPFEIHTLQNIDSAKAGDPHALLALALVASGNVRDSITYSQYETRVDSFISLIRTDIDNETDFWQKGYRLYQAMWNEFFVQSTNDSLAGYDFDQTRLSIIFENGQYNCISSSILYLILARYFDINAKGVVFSAHAFVQVESDDGRIIEVETTSKAGFDWIHNEQFYRKNAAEWLMSRRLPRATFQDYQNRKILEPYQIICLNMSNQHTDVDRMDSLDRSRLQEIHAFLCPEDVTFQRVRILLYITEFLYLEKKGDWQTAKRLFNIIEPILSVARESGPDDLDLKRNLMILQIGQNNTLLEIKDYERFYDSTKALLDSINFKARDSANYYQACLVNAFKYIEYCVNNQYFTKAEELSDLVAPFSNHLNGLAQNLQWALSMQMNYLWKINDWPEVIRVGKKKSELGLKCKNKRANNKNIERAYLNWAGSMGYNWPQVQAILQQCVNDTIANKKKCEKCLRELEERHNINGH